MQYQPLRLIARHAFALFSFFIAIASLRAFAQTATDVGTDLRFHKFQPKVAPERAAASAGASGQMINGMGVVAAQQMQALQQDKAARTPAQQKIDSNVIYTARMLAGQPAAPGVDYLYTGVDLDDNNNVVVDMVAKVSDTLLQQITSAGAQVLYTNAELRGIRAIIPPAQIEKIAASPDVIFISPKQGFATARRDSPLRRDFYLRPKLPPSFELRAANVRRQLSRLLFSIPGTPITGQGSVETEGDLTHQTFDARGTYGLTGAGLNVGVLSDGVTNRALSQATGDLPADCPGASPCLTILPGQTGVGDEGTAILEIIHDMVPGANLFFATADNSITSFAANITALQAAGCSIIVDDVFYFVESPFQDGQTPTVVSTTQGGIVTQAVNDAVAKGAFYFSSAGNEGNLDSNTSGTFEGDFNSVAAASPLPSGNVESFPGGTPFDAITSPGFEILGLWWADPLGGSNNDYDLYLLDSTSTTILAASTNIQNGTQDPIELIGSSSAIKNSRVVVFQKAGAANRFFHLVLFRGGLAVNTTGETHGHSAASGAYTVAATPAAAPFSVLTPSGPFPNAFNPGNKVEVFSSDGLRHIFFNGDSSAITPGNFSSSGGATLNKPDITGADGVSVTGVGGFGSPFYGTSAAAPSAASVAALVLSAKPGITPSQMRTALTSTAIDIMGSGFDRDSGSGIVMALPAIASLGVTGSANPELGTITANENPGNGNGTLEAGEGGIVQIQLKNTAGVQAASGVTATLSSANPKILINQPSTSPYADLTIGASGNNQQPFTFTLDPTFPCGQPAIFTLTVNYNGGTTRVLNFAVPTGALPIANTLGAKPVAPAGITTATGTQVNRINRNAIASACGTAKTFPGTIVGANHTFDSYTFTACQSGCVNFGLNSSGANLFESLYTPSYDPNNIGANYAGDPGLSSPSQSFGVNLTAGTSYTVVVNEVNGNLGTNSYTLKIPPCAFNCNVSQLPIARVHNVTVESGNTGGTGDASIDNGSTTNPPGGTVTLSQSPPGPYPQGNTLVLLTVMNSVGGAAQATATVTVINPGFSIATSLNSITVPAGQSGTEQISFTPNPGIGATLNFSCSGLPALANCLFSPSSIPAGTNVATNVTLTVTTTGPSASLMRPKKIYAAWMPLAGLGLAGMIVVAVPRNRRKTAMIVMILASFGMPMLGCGGGSHPHPQTPPGTSPITVTATSGNVTSTANFSLTVQ